MIDGISHLTFIVKDLERSSAFFKVIFDAQEVYSSGAKVYSLSKEKYLLVGEMWICIMEGKSLPSRTYNHVAFRILEEDFDLYESRVRSLDVDIKPSRPRLEGEGRSLYFYDYDNHLFELHTGVLVDRLLLYEV